MNARDALANLLAHLDAKAFASAAMQAALADARAAIAPTPAPSDPAKPSDDPVSEPSLALGTGVTTRTCPTCGRAVECAANGIEPEGRT